MSKPTQPGMKPTAGLSLGRQTIVFASFVIIVAGMKAAASIVVPLLCALFLMVLSLPVLHWLRRLRPMPEVLVRLERRVTCLFKNSRLLNHRVR